MREFNCPSGAILKISEAPFADSKRLYQAMLRELKQVFVTGTTDLHGVIKELFCIGFSSVEVEAALWECLKRCTYNATGADTRIDLQTFEPSERRQDYMLVCIEVAKDNILPFGKSLYAEFQRYSAMIKDDRA